MTDDSGRANERKTLHFDTDAGSYRSFWVALALTLLLVAWMGSGIFFPSSETSEAPPPVEVRPVAVVVTKSEARPVTQFFQAEGQALPDRDTSIRAETSGQIADVLIRKGEDVGAGAVIARFETTEREVDLDRARAELDRAQREFDNATDLRDRGVATVDRVAQADAALAAARAQFAQAEENLRNTDVTAPFPGRIETLDIDPGEFIQIGSEVGRIVDNAPLTIAIQVPQQSLRQLQNDQPARVLFITGEERAGSVTFVGTSAARETRTFLVEIEVPNADGAIPAGISAEIQIPVGQLNAHFLSPSTVSLSPEGALGVKTVDDDNIVQFYDIEVVRAQIEGIWVTGLPDEAQVITVGQGFVRNGEEVRPQPDQEALAEANQ